MSTTAWSPGQRALLRLLEREGLLAELPAPPAGETPADDLFFAAVAALVPPRALAELLAARLHLPLVDEASALADPAAAAMLSAAVASRCAAVPLGLDGELLEVAIANPLDLDAVKTIEFATGRRVRLRVATLDGVRRAAAGLYGTPPPQPLEPQAGAAALAPTVEPQPAAVPDPSAGGEPSPALAADPGDPAPTMAGPAAGAGPAPDLPLDPAADDAPAGAPPPRRCRLLVLAPEAARREHLGRMLAAASPAWLVTTAADASDAAVLAAVVAPDVVIVAAADPVYDDLAIPIASPVVSAGDDPDALVAAVRRLLETAGGPSHRME